MSRVVRSLVSLGAVTVLGAACHKPTNIIIEPKEPVLHKRGEQLRLVAHVMSGRMEDAKAEVTWSVDDSKVATVKPDGTVIAQTTGIATVTADSEGVKAKVPVEVTLVDKLTAVGKLELKYDEEGEGVDPKVIAATADGRILKVQPLFMTKNEKVCRIDRNGLVHATSPGDTVITASVDGQSVDIPCSVVEDKEPKKKK